MTRYSKKIDVAHEAVETMIRENGPITWRPLSFLPVFAHMIDSGVTDTAEQIKTLTEGLARPHVFDEALVDRMERLYCEQLGFIEIHRQQLQLWRAQNPSAAQCQEIERLEMQNSRLRQMNAQVLTLTTEIRRSC